MARSSLVLVALISTLAACGSGGGGGAPLDGGAGSAGFGGAAAQGATAGSDAGGAPSGGSSSGGGGGAGGSGAPCTEATASTDCAAGYLCADWSTTTTPDPRCTKQCDYWASGPSGCDGEDLCLDNDLCVPPNLLNLSTTWSGSCDMGQEGFGCRVEDAKVKGICFPYPSFSWPICAVLCRPLNGFGNESDDCVSSFDKCQPGLGDASGKPLDDMGICSS